MFNFSDLSAAAGATAEPAPRNLYRIVLSRTYGESSWGTSSATVQVHGTSPENAREHAIALVNEGEIDWDDLDPEHDCHGGDGYEYDDAECNSGDEVELLGDSEDADYETPDEEEEAAVAPAVAGPVAAAGPIVVDTTTAPTPFPARPSP